MLLVCEVCKHVVFGREAPSRCPVCYTPKESFKEDNNAINTPENLAELTTAEKKHTPSIVVSETPSGMIINVKVGDIEHPMDDDHWIMFIDTYIDGGYQSRISFNPGNYFAPIVECISDGARKEVKAVAMCNKHGMWAGSYKMPEEDIYECSNCGMKSDSVQHLCSPVKTAEKYICTSCNEETDEIRHICQPKLQKLKYVCRSCGRVSDDGSWLCDPKEIP